MIFEKGHNCECVLDVISFECSLERPICWKTIRPWKGNFICTSTICERLPVRGIRLPESQSSFNASDFKHTMKCSYPCTTHLWPSAQWTDALQLEWFLVNCHRNNDACCSLLNSCGSRPFDILTFAHENLWFNSPFSASEKTHPRIGILSPTRGEHLVFDQSSEV